MMLFGTLRLRCGRSAVPALALFTLLACDGPSEPLDPREEPEPVVLTAAVNVQLGDTPAGARPLYIVTGQVRAEQAGRRVSASVDSVLLFYRADADAGTDWSRLGRWFSFPVTGSLPFEATAGQRYEMWAIVYGSSSAGPQRVTAQDEWLASGTGL